MRDLQCDSGEVLLEAEEDAEIDLEAVAAPPYRLSVELRMKNPGKATLQVSDSSLELSLGPGQDDTLHVLIASRGRRKQIDLRSRPDVARWSPDPAEIQRFRKEFEGRPGWSERWVRLGLDVFTSSVRCWVQGRFMGQVKARMAEPPTLSLGRGTVVRGVSATPLDVEDHYLPLELSPYFNSRGLAPWESNNDGFTAPSDDLPFPGIARIGSVPFQVEEGNQGFDNVDLGEMLYRGRLPYIHTSSLSLEPSRTLLRVPKGYYDTLHLIGVSDGEGADVPSASVRMIKSGRGHAVTTEFDVPILDQEPRAGLPLRVEETGLWFVSVPLRPSEFQEFLEDEDDYLEIELTKMVTTDENLFPHPDGPRSGVHIFAATLETAPVRMSIRWGGGLPIFEMPSNPSLEIELKNQRGDPQNLRLDLQVTDPYGAISSMVEELTLDPWEERTLHRNPPWEKLGKFDVRIGITSGKGRSMEHRTAFVMLPPDTRRARRESPFGMWCFFEGHLGLPPERASTVMRMAGARWTLPGFLLRGDQVQDGSRLQAIERNLVNLNCGNVCCLGNECCDASGDTDGMIQRMRELPQMESWMVFWETFLSRERRDAFPPELLGRPPTPLTKEEEERLRNCWTSGVGYSRRVRDEFPDAKLVFGNGFPGFIAAMMERGYPKELIDAFGLDFDLFTSMPERQPGVLYAPFSNIYMLRALQRLYGYEEFPIYLTEAIYSSVGDGWLTERQQADYYVRSHLLALASGVVFFGMCTSPYDPGDEYFYSHYGPIGLLRRPPELIPRESFPAYSTMTRMLDLAHFDGVVPVNSTSVYVLRFTRSDGSPLHVLWTVRGRRPLVLGYQGLKPEVTDLFGNTQHLHSGGDDCLPLEIGPSPLYLAGVNHVSEIRLGEPDHERAEGSRFLAGFASLSMWKEDLRPVEEMENLRGSVPYIHGGIEIGVTEPGNEGPVLRVGVSSSQANHPLEIRYTVVEFRGGAEITESADSIGARVYGNSSWGRVLFLLEDPSGNRWLSMRADTYVDFDGWCDLEVPLPNGGDARRIAGTRLGPWSPSKAGQEPVFPMRLAGLVLEARSHVIYVDALVPVREPRYNVHHIWVRSRQGANKQHR